MRYLNTALALVSLFAPITGARSQDVPLYDDFSGGAVDLARWETVTEAGPGGASPSLSGGFLTMQGGQAESRTGLATRVRLGTKAAIEVDALGFTGVNQILQLSSGEGDFSSYIEYGIEGTQPDGTPTLHVWPSAGEAYAGPAPARGPYGPGNPLRLRVERDGRTYRFFANGQPIHTLTTDSLGPEARVFLYGFGASASRWDNVRLSGPEVRLDTPAPGASLSGAATVQGATGPGTETWRLDAGFGAYPAAWTRISSGRESGEASARWAPPANTEGPVTFRLSAIDASGAMRSYWTTARLDRAAIWEPRPGQIVGPTFTVGVRGKVEDAVKALFYDNGLLKASATSRPLYARLTPTINGTHELTVELVTRSGAKRTAGPVRVTVKRDLYGRNARVAPNGRAFLFPDGSIAPAVALNDSYNWSGFYNLWQKGDIADAEEYVRTLRTSGVNVVRMMLEAVVRPPEEMLEEPLGTYHKSVVQFWDTFFAMCERHGLTVLLTPWDTFWINQPWSASPYNKANGGPCETPRDFITSPAARRWQKARIKYMIDRWGNSPAIFAIDLLNEFDIWWNATPRERAAWVEDMAAYTRGYEMKRWGRVHMLTVSASAAEPRGTIADVIYRHPLFEFSNTHLYYWGTVNDPKNAIDPALSVNHGVRYALDQIQDGRPYTDTESGPIDRWVPGEAFDNEVHRMMTWAHFASGGAGTGMRWPYRAPHILTPGMQRNLLTVSQVAHHLDWSNPRVANADARLSASRDGLILMGSADARQAVVWLTQDTRKSPARRLEGARVSLSGMAPGRYNVIVWDATTGFPLSKRALNARNGRLDVPLPAFSLDLALTVRHQ